MATAPQPAKPPLIRVKSGLKDNRVALYEKDEAHPGGECFVAGTTVAEVAETAEVMFRLGTGQLVKTDEPVTQFGEHHGQARGEQQPPEIVDPKEMEEFRAYKAQKDQERAEFQTWQRNKQQAAAGATGQVKAQPAGKPGQPIQASPEENPKTSIGAAPPAGVQQGSKPPAPEPPKP